MVPRPTLADSSSTSVLLAGRRVRRAGPRPHAAARSSSAWRVVTRSHRPRPSATERRALSRASGPTRCDEQGCKPIEGGQSVSAESRRALCQRGALSRILRDSAPLCLPGCAAIEPPTPTNPHSGSMSLAGVIASVVGGVIQAFEAQRRWCPSSEAALTSALDQLVLRNSPSPHDLAARRNALDALRVAVEGEPIQLTVYDRGRRLSVTADCRIEVRVHAESRPARMLEVAQPCPRCALAHSRAGYAAADAPRGRRSARFAQRNTTHAWHPFVAPHCAAVTLRSGQTRTCLLHCNELWTEVHTRRRLGRA